MKVDPAGNLVLLALLCVLASFGVPARGDSLSDYANLTGKTVLMSSALPLPPDSLLSEAQPDKATALARIEGEFSNRGIGVLQDGPHFVILFPEGQRKFVTQLSLRGQVLATNQAQETILPGGINFNTAADQVLALYSDISRRTILRPLALPPSMVRLQNTCPLSREEVAYAIATVLGLNGLAVVEDGAKFVQVVPMGQRSLVRLRAPKAEPAERLLDPKQVLSTGDHGLSKPVSPMERDLERWRKALYEFLHYKGPPDRSAQRLLALYASLADKRAEQSNQFDGIPIWFHVNTPLSKNELMYAIETTFTLNGLGIKQVDGQQLCLERLSERATSVPGRRPVDWKRALPELLSELADEDFNTRFNAGMALARLGSNAAPAVPVIGHLLATEPLKVHDVMLKVVENCPSAAQSIKPTLQRCLTNSNVNLRIGCARTLWILDDGNLEVSRPVAKRCLRETDAGARIEAASLLWRMDKDATEVVPALVALLSDPETAYDFRTIKLLGEIGPPAKEATAALRVWLNSQRGQKTFAIDAAVQTLQHIGSEP